MRALDDTLHAMRDEHVARATRIANAHPTLPRFNAPDVAEIGAQDAYDKTVAEIEAWLDAVALVTNPVRASGIRWAVLALPDAVPTR